jgi:hypothetical protein
MHKKNDANAIYCHVSLTFTCIGLHQQMLNLIQTAPGIMNELFSFPIIHHVYIPPMPHAHPKKLLTLQQNKWMSNRHNFQLSHHNICAWRVCCRFVHTPMVIHV